jgi:hypothetical protein
MRKEIKSLCGGLLKRQTSRTKQEEEEEEEEEAVCEASHLAH